MRSIVCFVLYFTTVASSFAQGTFWGAIAGGWGDGGRIYKASGDGSNAVVVKTFSMTNINGANHDANTLIVGSDNKLYGTTFRGGVSNRGVIYSLDQTTHEFKKIFDVPRNLNTLERSGPCGSLVEGSDGFLYGYLNLEGNGPTGIFKVKKDGTQYQEFEPSTAIEITADALMVKANDGNVYGVSRRNGDNKGFIFRLTPSGTFTKVVDLTANGPVSGDLLYASNGKLYGFLFQDGWKVYSIDPEGTNYATGDVPRQPSFNFVEGSGSQLYGIIEGPTTKRQLFQIGLDLTGFATLYDFTEKLNSFTRLSVSNDMIYGTNGVPGDQKVVVFRIGTDGNGYSVLKQLDKSTGTLPVGVTVASDNLFLVNSTDNTFDMGNIVTMKTDGADFSKVHDFFLETDGTGIVNHLILLPNGNIMGATAAGGEDGRGVIFNIDTNDEYKVVYNFEGGEKGNYPTDTPVAGPAGFYYGITQQGGTTNAGIIYKIKSDGTGFEKIFDFAGSDLGNPSAGLTYVEGRLFGMTQAGGANNIGVIFSININGSGFKTVMDFNAVNGGRPVTNLIYHTDQFLYGVSNHGVVDNLGGVLFKINPDGTGYVKLAGFSDTNFYSLLTDPFIDTNGDILVTATRGGAENSGGIFRVKADGGSRTMIHEFNLTVPNVSYQITGNLTRGPGGLIYGIEPNGGPLGTGTAFKMNSDGSNYTNIELGLTSAAIGNITPWSGLLYISPEPDIVLGLVDDASDVRLYPNPANDEVHLKLNDLPVDDITVSIVDATGRMIDKQVVSHGHLNIQSLSRGVYYLHPQLDNKVVVLRLVKL